MESSQTDEERGVIVAGSHLIPTVVRGEDTTPLIIWIETMSFMCYAVLR